MRNRKSLVTLFSSGKVGVTREGGLRVQLAGKRTVRIPAEHSSEPPKVRDFLTSHGIMTVSEAEQFCPEDSHTRTALRFIIGIGSGRLDARSSPDQTSTTA